MRDFLKPNALPCWVIAAVAGACVVSPPEATPDRDVTTEAMASDVEAQLRAIGADVDQPLEVCEAQTDGQRAADEVICGGECKDQYNDATAKGCAGKKGSELTACLQGLCASAKADHARKWPDGPPACPATNGACESPVDPTIRGTCTKTSEWDWTGTWNIDGCAVYGGSTGYRVHFGSVCTYSCIKDDLTSTPET